MSKKRNVIFKPALSLCRKRDRRRRDLPYEYFYTTEMYDDLKTDEIPLKADKNGIYHGVML